MKNLLMLLVPMVFAAAPVAAQSPVLVAGSRLPRSSAADATADVALLLVSPSADVVRFGDGWLLAQAVVAPIALGTDARALDQLLPKGCDANLYWQKVGCGRDGLSISPIALLSAPVDELAAVDRASEPAAKPLPIRVPVEGSLPFEFTLHALRPGLFVGLNASFEAPTDDYDLGLITVAMTRPGTAEVYLFRRLPGKGEGRRDVIETHAVDVILPPVHQVLVYLLESTERCPIVEGNTKLVARLPR
jgi:hypothetical protein